MRIFDLHCDTLACSEMDGRSLRNNSGQLDLERGTKLGAWVQTFACFIASSIRGPKAYQLFLRQHEILMQTVKNNPDKIEMFRSGKTPTEGKCSAIFSIEGGTAIGGDLTNIEKCKKMGVSFFTLVWNGDNELAHGVGGEDAGLTQFGKEAVRELERNNIIVDISHLNDKGIDDVMTMAQKPIMATHSNARSVHFHYRNLRDDQFKYLVEHGGLCGINYYREFINGREDYTPDDMHRHIDRMLELGGKDIIALGSDFDGASMSSWLCKVEHLTRLYDYLCRWYTREIADKIFYENAMRFTEKNLLIRG